jgi:hypothetical protein
MAITWMGEACDFAADPVSGATRVRLTTSLYHHVNVYHEHACSTPDGRRIAILRSHFCDPRMPPYDLLVGDLYSLKIALVEKDVSGYMVATGAWSGWIYYVNANRELMRVNMMTLEKESVWTKWPFAPDFILQTISPDLRYMVGILFQTNFLTALVRIDLVERSWKVIYEDYEITNAHPIYNPVDGKDISVMRISGVAVNDRDEVRDLGKPRMVGHFFIDNEGKNVRPLPIGGEHCPSSTGHTGWVGGTGKLAVVCGWNGEVFAKDERFPDGNIFVAGPGDKSPTYFRTPGHRFNHIAVSKCGRYFVAESYTKLPAVPLVVGNFLTGKFRELLQDCKSSMAAAATTHPHAYFTADNKHVIYNADPNGIGHVWAARVPSGFLESLD